MGNNDRSSNQTSSSTAVSGSDGKKRWRKRRRRRGGGGGGSGGGRNSDSIPEIEGETESITGVLEVLKDGSGWLRCAKHMYLADENGQIHVLSTSRLVADGGRK